MSANLEFAVLEKPKTSLRERVLRAGSLTIGGQFAGQVLRLSSNLIMTRLLFPEMFGVMAIVTVIIQGLTSLSETGIGQSIVQSKRGGLPAFLDTAWTVQLLRGLIIGLVIVLVAGLLHLALVFGLLPDDSVYAHPMLAPVLALSSLSVIIGGFRSTYSLALFRKVHVGKNMAIDLISQAAGILGMIAWAMVERSIWALAIGGIVSEIAKTALSHLMVREGHNRLQWDPDSLRELFGFGKWLFVTSIFVYLNQQSDKLVLGGLVSAEALGIYTIAFFLATAYQLLVGGVVTKVMYPAFCEIKNHDPARLSAVYYRSRAYVDLGSCVVAGVLCSSGDLLVGLLYDERYAEAGWMLKVLAVSLLSVGFRSVDQCLMAMGHAKFISLQAAIQGLVPLLLVPAMFGLFGLHGAVWAVALSFVPNMLLSFWFLRREGILNLGKEFRVVPVFFVVLLAGIGLRELFGF